MVVARRLGSPSRRGGVAPAHSALREHGVEWRAVRFEKWQALGNDYAIVEAAELSVALTPARIRALCAPHTGVGADGVLLISETDEPGFVADLRIFNPDGSEAQLSGNGVRQAVLYLRRAGWTDADRFSIRTAAGEVRPLITGSSTATVDMGRARLRSEDFPSGPEDGRATLTVGGRELAFQHVQIGNPQCAIEVQDGLEALDLAALGAPIERHELFPNRTNVSFWRRESDDSIRARIFERGVGETLSSGTGATGAAIAAVLGGLDSAVTVRLDGGELLVEVGEDLHVDLTGWAMPVYAGSLAEDFLETIERLEGDETIERLEGDPASQSAGPDAPRR
jgi:diaminopimelate epimerase